MGKIKQKILALSLLLLFLAAGASFVLAQEKSLEVQYPQIPGAETPVNTKILLPQYVKYVFNFSVWLAGFIAFGAMIYGGVRLLASAGKPAATGDAKDQMFAGILGLLLLLSSYIILNAINPQLLFLNVNRPPIDEPPPVVVPMPPLAEQTLYSQEIPIGRLIDGVGEISTDGSTTSPAYSYEGVLAETRIERILGISEEIWDTSQKILAISKEISDASQKLEELSRQCVCSNCSSNCGGCSSCPCSCGGDPCAPVREEIKRQQAILRTKPAGLPPLGANLENLAERLNTEKEKLANALTELEKGEALTKLCPSSVTADRKTSVLLSYGDFWSYKEGLEKGKIIKKIEIRKTWDNISADNDETTFYCAETPFEVSSIEEASQSDIAESISQIENTQEPKLSCKITMPIGKSVDYAEDIANGLAQEFLKTINEIPVITQEIPKEVANAKNLAPLPDCSVCSDWCSCRCQAKMCCSPYGCWCCGCLLAQSCQGSPCPEDKKKIKDLNALIRANHKIITDAHGNITIFDDEIHNLINGDQIHNEELIGSNREPSWAYDVINQLLPAARNGFRKCVNLSSDWAGALSGEKIMTKNVLMCDEAKSTCQGLEEGYLCHGEGDNNAFSDYFCGETESK